MDTRTRAAVAFILLAIPLLAHSQVQWGQEYDRQIKSRKTLAAFGPEQFGENVNLYDGTVSFSATDVDVPGNAGLGMTVSRKFSVGVPANAAQDGLFGNWNLSIPYVGVISSGGAPLGQVPNPAFLWPAGGTSQARCSTGSAYEPQLQGGSGGGTLFALDAQTSPKLVRPAMAGMRWVTKGMWYFSCAPSLASGQPGEGFIGVNPSGVKYTFNWMVSHFYPGSTLPGMGQNQIQVHRADVRLYPTRIEDRFGNWVNYQWQGRRLLSMTASDGRRVDFAYGADDQITRVTSHGRTWTYSYIDAPSAGVGGRLTAVTNPDGTRWSFGQDPGNYVDFEPKYEMRPGPGPGGGGLVTREYEILERVARCSYDHYLSSLTRPFEVTHPSGARAVFTFKTMRHGRTNVPGECQYGWDNGGDGGIKEEQNRQNMYPAFKDVMSLLSKRVDGPGLVPLTWQYGYANLQACVADECATQGTPTRKQVTVTTPDGDQTVSTFGKQYGENEGQLLEVQTVRGGVVASRTQYTYVSNAQAAQMPFPDVVGLPKSDYPEIWSEAALRPMSGTITTQEGVTYVSATQTFDTFARPVSVTRESTLGYTKTDVTEYHDDLSRWVTGQVARQYNAQTGQVMSQTDYNDRSLAWRSYAFGKLKFTMDYNADGTVASVTDGRGQVLRLSGWKRGIPQLIRHPGTPEAPEGATEQATVNDSGWLTGLIDETGYETIYDYDAMGRLSRIRYPVGDRVAYHDTVFELRQLGAGDHLPVGVTVGQWRHQEVTGNAVKNIYLDAMWRPVLEHGYDAGNLAATLMATRTEYDSDGQVAFATYPSSQANPAAVGVRTQYDVLGRVVRQEKHSEHGALATVTEYLAGLQVRVTNPRGQQTTTGFQAWDQPSHDLPVWSHQPEGKVVEVERHHQFGWPLKLTQRSVDGSLRQERKYVYDGAAQLCKTIEPETGAQVMGYDEAGNLVWSAAGLSIAAFGSTTDCQHQAAWDSGRVTRRTYDGRNRLEQLLFKDGVGDQAWTYHADGLPDTVTTWNAANRQYPVINVYRYNRRRLLVGESMGTPNWFNWSTGYGYDAYGNLHTLVYPDGRVLDYAPNALGQPSQVRDGSNKAYASGISYYANGSIKQFTYGNGIVHTMQQNARQMPGRVTSSGGVLDFAYTFDKNGNVETIWDHARDNGNGQFGRWMQYDGLDRLTAVGSCQFGGDCWHRFGYDALDRIRSWKLGEVKDYADYVYDTNNRLSTVRNTAGTPLMNLDYDAQGNLSQRGGQSYVFDTGNRLRDVPGKEAYRYDVQGRRMMTWRPAGLPGPGVTVFFYNQGGQLLYQYQESVGSMSHVYTSHIYLGTSLLASVDAAGVAKYQHTDALGSPAAVTNEAGQVVERNDYEPYGAVIGKPTFTGIGYTGHVMDGVTGLTYMQQRYYDQNLGLFLSVDPVAADANTGAMFNRYKYADNNPYRFTDPDGRQEIDAFKPIRALWSGYLEGRAISSGYNDVQSRKFRETHAYKLVGAAVGLRGIRPDDDSGKSRPVAAGAKLGPMGRVAAGYALVESALTIGEVYAEHVAGLAMAHKRSFEAGQENLSAVAAKIGEAMEPNQESTAPQSEASAPAPTTAAAAPKPGAAAGKPTTAVRRAVDAPQGKYRNREK